MPIQQKRGVILLSIDAVRSDRLGCYGYNRGITKNWDSIAREGVLFENCIAPSSLTPICMSSILCGAYPNKHTVRDPFCRIEATTIAEILKGQGYKTAGFVGNGLLGARHNFNRGFDFFDEPKGDASWGTLKEESGAISYEGHWWIDNMFKWLEENYKSDFFIWGHYYETHEGAENSLLKKGWIKEGVLADFRYMGALIKLMDEKLLGGLLTVLEKLNIAEDTILVVMADHGTGIGEHPGFTTPWRDEIYFPQHLTLYDQDLKVPLVMKGKGLPRGKKIKGMVRSIDVVPTLLSFLEIPIENLGFDGINLCPATTKGNAQGLVNYAYAEELFEKRGPGAIQALRTEECKFIRNLTKGSEEFYNLKNDPSEQKNLLPGMRGEEEKKMLENMRGQLNNFLIKTKSGSSAVFSAKEKAEIDSRLRALGYIE